MKSETVSWMETFYRDIKPHIFLRKEDGLLILPPSRVYKINDTAFELLAYLDRGGRLAQIGGLDDERLRALEDFFLAFKDLYENSSIPPGVERVPYDFSFTRLPVLGEIAITYRCNNACRFCYAGCGNGKQAQPELPARLLKKIISLFKHDAKIPFFSFTGGEPLLRDDLERLIRHARTLGLTVNLITNGTLATPSRAMSLYRAGLRTVQVSIESPSEAIHDELTGVDGSYRRTVAGIAAFREAGIAVQTNTTVTQTNIESLAAFPSFLSTLGVRKFSMNLFIPTQHVDHSDSLFIRYDRIGSFVDMIRKAAFTEGLTFYWYSPTPHCVYNPIARGMGNKSCAAMDGLLSVTPAGDIIPCSSWDEPMGNLLREAFGKIWFSTRASWFKQKKYAPSACAGCTSFSACQAACPLYWKFAGTGEIACKEKRGV